MCSTESEEKMIKSDNEWNKPGDGMKRGRKIFFNQTTLNNY